jgi:hypothetical protein
MSQGAKRGFEVIGDQVILHHRIAEEEEADLFDPATSDLRIQLRSVEGFPLAQLTLISDPTVADPRRLWWPLDLRAERHREVAHALRRSFRAEIRLVGDDLTMLSGFEVAGERELNTAVVLKRASQMLEQLPAEEGVFAAAVAAAEDLPQPPWDELPPPFDPLRLPEPAGLAETTALLETLAEWTSGERRDELVLLRSFPLDHLEAIVAELIGAALERGVALPGLLADRAIDSGQAADRSELAARLFAAFDRFTDRERADDETTARNWRRLLDECSKWGARPDVDAWDRAERTLERHGLLDESELAPDLEALEQPEQLETGRLVQMLARRKLRLRAMLALLDRDFAANRESITAAFGRLGVGEIPAAVTALAARGEEVSGELALALASPAPQARQAAAVLLGSLALERTLMPLLKALAAESTPIWPAIARAVAAAGPAAQRSLERALDDARFDPERLALVIAEMDEGRDWAQARLGTLAESGAERAVEVLRLVDRGRLGVGETSPAESYAALLHRAAKGETIADEEVAQLIEPYERAVHR